MPGRKRLVLALALLIAGLSVLFASAQTNAEPETAKSPQALWGDFGIVINNTPGNTIQQNPKIINTSDGNLAMVWEDGRNGFMNVFVQKLDASGARLWGDVGVQTCGNLQGYGDQNYPSLADDGAGGVIVVWQGYCNGTADVFAQRVSATGVPLWGTAGVAICNAPAGQFAPEVVPDGAGGAVVTWYDYRSGAGEDIYAQRVNKDGEVLWPANGVPVCAATGTQWYPKLAADGAGGVIIVWTDGRSGSSDNHIYGQRLGPDGKPLWAKDGLAICAAPNNQEKPVIMASDKEAIIAWQDSRSGNVDIYAQKIDGDGKALWAQDGIAIAAAPYSQEDPQLSPDGAGGALIAWADNREEDTDIYVQKVSGDGKIEWDESGRPLAKAQSKQNGPKVVKLASQDWVVLWQDYRNGTSLLYGQKINSSGVALWQEDGVPLAPGGRGEEKAAVALASDGQPFIVWQDRRNGETDIFGQKVSPAGALAWSDNGKVISKVTGSVPHQNAAMIDSGHGEIIIVFEDARSGFLNIYAQKISLQGALLWGKNAIPMAKVKADQTNPHLVSDGAGGAIVIWEDHRNPNYIKIYGQRISAQGKRTWEGGSRQLTDLDSQQTSPGIVSDGDGGALVVWQDERNPLSLKDLYGQRLSSTGEQLWGVNGVPVCTENGDQVEPAMVGDGHGGAFIAWTDYRRGDRNPDIYAQRLGLVGKSFWDKDGLLVCGAPDAQKTPSLSRDSDGGVVIVWTDKGGGSNDIYAQKVNLEGKPLWLTDGIPVCQSPRTQQNPAVNPPVVVWEDYRYGNWDIFANSVTPQGKLLWGDEGVPVVTQPLTQYAPQLIPWTGQNTIVAWEDYRNGKQYEIYMQLLNEAGKTQWGGNGFMVKSTDGARSPKLLSLPGNNVFLVVWEDYTGGGKAIAGQLYSND